MAKRNRVTLAADEAALLEQFRLLKAGIPLTISHAQDMIKMAIDDLEEIVGAKIVTVSGVIPDEVRKFLEYKPELPAKKMVQDPKILGMPEVLAADHPPVPAPATASVAKKVTKRRHRRRVVKLKKGHLSHDQVKAPTLDAVLHFAREKKRFTVMDVANVLTSKGLKFNRAHVSLILSVGLTGLKVVDKKKLPTGGPPANVYEVTGSTVTFKPTSTKSK